MSGRGQLNISYWFLFCASCAADMERPPLSYIGDTFRKLRARQVRAEQEVAHEVAKFETGSCSRDMPARGRKYSARTGSREAGSCSRDTSVRNRALFAGYVRAKRDSVHLVGSRGAEIPHAIGSCKTGCWPRGRRVRSRKLPTRYVRAHQGVVRERPKSVRLVGSRLLFHIRTRRRFSRLFWSCAVAV